MNIVFIHYHLKTGGVTSVICRQIEALQNDCRLLVLAGETPPVSFPAPAKCIDGLGYDQTGLAPIPPEQVAGNIVTALRSHFGTADVILHVHNPTLAKNRRFPAVLKMLQQQGVTLLLQIHDFAEDGRPHTYFKEDYPADCHYSVINSRDYDLLRQAGLQEKGLHRIFNTVPPLPVAGRSPGSGAAAPVLYPIRALRRKNIGEAVLLSLFFQPHPLAITQPPNSPEDIRSHADWQTFTRRHNLNVVYEAGVRADFATLVRQAPFLITTSITEGFGFSYLEPWTAGKLLWGRKLADICRDFEAHQIALEHLYTTLQVPLQWIDAERLRAQWGYWINRAHAAFDRKLPPKAALQHFDDLTLNGTIDFGRLDEVAQQQTIRALLNDPGKKQTLIALNPFLASPADCKNGPELIAHNRRQILTHYNLKRYRETLLSIYRHVRQTPVRQQIDKKRLLDAFLAPQRFSLLKWGRYPATTAGDGQGRYI